MRSARCAATAIAATLSAGITGNAAAQMPNIDQTFLNQPSNLDRDVLRFCVYPRSATAEIDRAVALALGDALLTPVEIVEVEAAISIEGIDTIPIGLEDLYLLLENECNAFMGIDLATGVYPDWLILSRSYLEAAYVLVTRAGEYTEFNELEPPQAVATQSMSLGDSRFGLYLRTLPEDQRLRRVPYPTTHLQLERLLDGTVDAALVWEPWLMTDIAHYDEIEEISPGNFTFGERVIGIGLHINDSFLRNSLDGAIEALSGDGTLEAIVRD
jgi:hypothetical protein